MNVADKIGSVTSELKAKANQALSEKLEQSNEDLKRENTLLRQQEDGANRDRMLALLDRMETTPRKRKRGGLDPHPRRGRGCLRAGARAGRERYDQIRRSWSRMLSRTPADDVIDGVRDVGQTAMERVGSVAETVKEQVGSGSHTAKDQTDETGKN